MRKEAVTPNDKYIAFKTAHQTITQYRSSNNFLAAYVITFSLIEDRLCAMFVVWHRDTKGGDPKSYVGFTKIVNQLCKVGLILEGDANLLRAEAIKRNELLHSAMWNLPVFTDEEVERAMSLARMIDKYRRAQKKLHEKSKK